MVLAVSNNLGMHASLHQQCRKMDGNGTNQSAVVLRLPIDRQIRKEMTRGSVAGVRSISFKWDSDDQACLVSGRRHVAGNVSSVRSSVSNRKEIQITPLKYSMTKVQIYNLLKYFFLKNKYAGHVYYFCLLILQGLFDISSRSLSLLTLRRG